jgi:ketosteroid isomerase-like protein
MVRSAWSRATRWLPSRWINDQEEAMSIEANKKIGEAYFEAQRSGDLFKGLALLSEDATWAVPGQWEMAGTMTKAQMAKMMEGLNQFDGGLTFTHHSVTAEDDRVAVLTVVDAKLKDGRTYHNNIFFLFIIKDGMIHHVTEAVDSYHSRKFWLGK